MLVFDHSWQEITCMERLQKWKCEDTGSEANSSYISSGKSWNILLWFEAYAKSKTKWNTTHQHQEEQLLGSNSRLGCIPQFVNHSKFTNLLSQNAISYPMLYWFVSSNIANWLFCLLRFGLETKVKPLSFLGRWPLNLPASEICVKCLIMPSSQSRGTYLTCSHMKIVIDNER